MSFEMPPKMPSIWSARITEIAIVISACRSSCPWFQRRKTCWMRSPSSPIASAASSTGTSQPTSLYVASLDAEKPISSSPDFCWNHDVCICSAR